MKAQEKAEALKNASGSEFSSREIEELNAGKVDYLRNSVGTDLQTVTNLMKYMSRQGLAKLLTYIDVFRLTRDVAGSIVECGVYFGNGLMTWAKLSAALEPYNYRCKVIGFDTFCGNKGISDEDFTKYSDSEDKYIHNKEGGYYADSYDDLLTCIDLFDKDRPLKQFEKVELVPCL